MYQPLVPCPACDRHVRATEAACPFCAAALPLDIATKIVPGTNQRLSRAAAFVFTASVAIAGCGSDTGGAVPLYGAPAVDGGEGGGGTGGTGGEGGGGMALYGAPPTDAGPEDDGGGSADYGAPPPQQDAG